MIISNNTHKSFSNLLYLFVYINENNSVKDMKKNRNIVRLTESQLKQIVTESVKKVLNEKYNYTRFPYDHAQEIVNTEYSLREPIDRYEDDESRPQFNFAETIETVDEHLSRAYGSLINFYNVNDDDFESVYGLDETDYRYLRYVHKCIKNASNVLVRLRDRMVMRMGGEPNDYVAKNV